MYKTKSYAIAITNNKYFIERNYIYEYIKRFLLYYEKN